MNTDDPAFRDRVREVVRDCFLRGDDANAIRAIRDWRLFDDLKDIVVPSAANFSCEAIGNVFEDTDSDNFTWLMPVAPVTGMRFMLSNCVVLAGDRNFLMHQLTDGVIDIRIRGMHMAALGTDTSPELQAERAEHARTRTALENTQSRLDVATRELSYWRGTAEED